MLLQLWILYLIGVLPVKLLYVFESVVELSKLIWSRDGSELVSPHAAKREEEEKNSCGKEKEKIQTCGFLRLQHSPIFVFIGVSQVCTDIHVSLTKHI